MLLPNTGFYLGVTALLLQVSSANNAHTDEVCMTRRSTVSPRGAVPTHYHLRTYVDECKVYVTKTPVKTINPPAKTKTKTITVTTTTEIDVLQQTDTITSTAFTTTISTSDIPTFTVTSTELTTITSTSTLDGPTVVPTPNGFAPVQSSLPGAVAKKRSVVRGSSHRESSLWRSHRQPMCPVAGSKPQRSWPAEVNCYGVVEKYDRKTITVTAHKTKTVTACPRTTTVSVTKTCTSTKVVTTADALTTITTTSTETSVVTNAPTTTIASTSTVSVVVPTYTATVYAICSQSNIAGSIGSSGINGITSNNNQNTNSLTTAATTKEDCCNSCGANMLCVGFAFYSAFPAGQQCYVFASTQATCSLGDYSLEADTSNPPLSADGGYFIGNGYCGMFETVVADIEFYKE
ncbi:hypothetical protein GGI35DRAFT_477409 [Trichoderma velutinum]